MTWHSSFRQNVARLKTMTSKLIKAVVLSAGALSLLALDIAYIDQPLAQTQVPAASRINNAGRTTLAENTNPGKNRPQTIRVCATQSTNDACQFANLADAINSARAGDTVLLSSGIYRQAVVVKVSGITIKGEPGAHLQGTAIEGKAALVVRADNVTIEGIECSGIQVRDRNGACVRIEGRDLVIRDVYFHDNQEGVLGGRGGTVLIENSRFERNGFNGGFAHTIYITKVDKFIFRNNQVLSTKDEGQGVKSRAKQTVIENNVIAGLDARDSRAIDVPNGGAVTIRNNVLQKGANSSNSQMIGLGLEGNLHASGSAVVENNILIFDRDLSRLARIIDDIAKLASTPGTAVANKMKGEVTVRNNRIVGAGRVESGEETTKVDNVLHRSRQKAGVPAAPALPDLPPAAN